LGGKFELVFFEQKYVGLIFLGTFFCDKNLVFEEKYCFFIISGLAEQQLRKIFTQQKLKISFLLICY